MANEVEEVLTEEDDEREELVAALLGIMGRADKAGIKYDKNEEALILHLPCGRERRNFTVRSLQMANALQSIEFERFSYVESYRGIVDRSTSHVEIMLRSIDVSRLPSILQFRRLFGASSSDDEASYKPIIIQDESTDIAITLGPASKEAVFLTNTPRMNRVQISIKMEGLKKISSEHTLGSIIKLSSSLFFQIDLLKNIPLSLVRYIDATQLRQTPKLSTESKFRFPNHEYDHAPLALYFYGRSAGGMPLLRYQAYYQVLEYYFPFYSQLEAKKIIQANLKDPSFRYDRDSDIIKIISALKSNNYSGFGDEKNQLRILTNECTNNDDIKAFISGNEHLAEYLKTQYKNLSRHKIGFDQPDADMRNDLADRIYDIRCKIVHSKGANKDGKQDFILPFSKESDLLQYEISLVEYVAQRALISGGVRISL